MSSGDQTPLRRLPVHRALNRPSLLLGAERELTLMTGLVSAVMIFGAMSISAAIIGLVIWLGTMQLLRIMAKYDPMMSKVYTKHIRYQEYYGPASTPFRED